MGSSIRPAASGLVIHVVEAGEKHTEVLTSERIRIGRGGDYDVRVGLPDVANSSRPALEVERSNGHYIITDFDPSLQITYNATPLIAGTPVEDGDELHFEETGVRLQFFTIATSSALLSPRLRDPHVAPFIEQAAIESAATARRDDAKIFLREFTRELVREINPSTKILVLTITLSLVGGILYLGFAGYKELQRSRRLIDEQNKQLELMRGEVTGTKKEIQDLDASNQVIRDSLSLAPKLRSMYGNGVCLISGTYIFVEAGTGRPLRSPETLTGEDGALIENEGDSLQLTPEGNGPVKEMEVIGTGFHVGGGYILTNRHVVQPWTADERAQAMNSSVNGRPRLTKLMAFFPERRQAIGLKMVRVAQRDEDLAACRLDIKELPTELPVLPLDKDAESVSVGKDVVMMGYTSGPYRMLATLPEYESRSIQERCGSSLEILLSCLAERRMIKPLTTQGHITDLYTRRIVYDAATGEGGSGAPVFGPSGRVIGVNFAVFVETSASNFAVPVRYAITLLERSGWLAPESNSQEKNPSAKSTSLEGRD